MKEGGCVQIYNVDPPLTKTVTHVRIYTGHKKGSKGARIALLRFDGNFKIYLFSKKKNAFYMYKGSNKIKQMSLFYLH